AAEAAVAGGWRTIGLLGTEYTMGGAEYGLRLNARGLRVLLPEGDDRLLVNRVIFEELVRGIVREDSRSRCLAVLERLREGGADAVILACTELSLLVRPSEARFPVFDTTRLHAEAGADFAVG